MKIIRSKNEEITAIKVIGGQSKAGRHFITCAYAE